MSHYRISEAAALLGVSSDTVRRWIQAGKLTPLKDASGRQAVSGTELAALAVSSAPAQSRAHPASSARNRALGLVTKITKDTVMAQVDLQCGPFRFVSLMSAEAVEDLGLEIGDAAFIVVKATTVIVEKPGA